MTQPLALIEIVGAGVGLEGVLEIDVENEGTAPTDIETLDVHGLRFVNVATGEAFVIVHPCTCRGLATQRQGVETGIVHHALGPQGHASVKLDDFGCGGGFWTPPPPGTYDVSYRVVIGAVQKRPADPTTAACRIALLDPAFWQPGAESKPLRIELAKPRRRKPK